MRARDYSPWERTASPPFNALRRAAADGLATAAPLALLPIAERRQAFADLRCYGASDVCGFNRSAVV